MSSAGVRLTTLEVTFPRIVLAEFNTHRVFSRNSASSRAIPVEKRIASVEAEPFVPAQFGKNQKGMQASENLDESAAGASREVWLAGLRAAVQCASTLALIGVHKQLANRLLEPFLWHTVVVTATEWSNFFALRCNPDAQPEIRTIAEMMRDVMAQSTPVRRFMGQWHLPYVTDEERAGWTRKADLARISSARCARVSYLTHEGKCDPTADLALAKRLLNAGHMSPFEHAARDDGENFFCGNFRGWIQYRKLLADEDDFAKATANRKAVSE